MGGHDPEAPRLGTDSLGHALSLGRPLHAVDLDHFPGPDLTQGLLLDLGEGGASLGPIHDPLPGDAATLVLHIESTLSGLGHPRPSIRNGRRPLVVTITGKDTTGLRHHRNIFPQTGSANMVPHHQLLITRHQDLMSMAEILGKKLTRFH